MQVPPIISRTTLSELSFPNDTHAVRIIAHGSSNPTMYRMRRQRREYRFERDGLVGKHILDIPLSLWMHGASESPFRETHSIADDFRNAESGNFTIHIIPLVQPAKPEAITPPPATTGDSDIPEMLDLLETLILRIADSFDPELTRQNLTPELEEAFKRSGQVAAERLFAKYGRTAIVGFQNTMWPPPAEESPAATTTDKPAPKTDAPGETDAERRARVMREGKARKKAEREAHAAQSA